MNSAQKKGKEGKRKYLPPSDGSSGGDNRNSRTKRQGVGSLKVKNFKREAIPYLEGESYCQRYRDKDWGSGI